MLRTATTWLTALGVLWHAVVGCCAHHAHAADDHRSAVAIESRIEHDAGSHSCCRGHHHFDHELPPAVKTEGFSEHGDHPAQEPCDETTCSFLGAKPAAAVEMTGFSPTPLRLPTATAMKPSRGIALSRLVHPPNDRPPPLRTHLALNILLI